jgi:rhamnulokinase
MAVRVFGAVDVGASAGRVMAGIVDAAGVRVEPVHRFPNAIVESAGNLRWNLTGLYEQVQHGLQKLKASYPHVESIGIDTWGVDYGLLDHDGRLLAEPVAYRDERTAKVIDDVHAAVSPEELFAVNGLQFLPFTTLYQLASEKSGALWQQAARVVLLPDLLAYWLTGLLRTEVTNASTTGLLDVRTREWSRSLLDTLDIHPDLLPALEEPGTVRGITSGRRLRGTPVTSVGSHDTASAVAGIPATTRHFAYIVAGTWSLVGLELDQPVLTAAARLANFSNEAGVCGRTRFLRNTGGLWLLAESMRDWGRTDLDQLLAAAATLPAGGPIVDVDDPALLPPGNMPARITAAAAAGHRRLASPVEVVRCIIDSLATAYAATVARVAALANASVEVIHLVGGGSQNPLLCQLTADLVGLPVIAGPTEATTFGNLTLQACAHGALMATLDEVRAQIAASIPLHTYRPR